MKSPALVYTVVVLGLLAAARPGSAAPDASAPKLLSTTGGGGKTWSNLAELKAAAEKGDPRACEQYGQILLTGTSGAPKDAQRGIALLEQAAKGGQSNAAFRLGKIYDDGEIVPQDYAKALDCYRTAAYAGVPEAQYNIGVIYASGHGMKRDIVEGLAWLIVARKNGADNGGEQQLREHYARYTKYIAKGEARAVELEQDLAAHGHPVSSDSATPAPTSDFPSKDTTNDAGTRLPAVHAKPDDPSRPASKPTP